MKTGDQVRLLKGREEGIVKQIHNDGTVEVEIEDGFQIPILKEELVVVNKEEEKFFEKPEKETSSAKQKSARPEPRQEDKKEVDKGVFLAFAPVNDHIYAAYICNNTGYKIPFTVTESEQKQSQQGLNEYGTVSGVAAGTLAEYEHSKLKEYNIKQFDQWPSLIFQLLFFTEEAFTETSPYRQAMQFRANTFFKSSRVAPVLQKEAYTFRIWNPNASENSTHQSYQQVSSEAIKERLMSYQDYQDVASNFSMERPDYENDLHIENLMDDADNMSNSEILEAQLHVFERNLDNAIATGMEEIVFIHGVGNGVLRNEIHKRLAKSKDIKYFKDARKEKFGYGATLVRIH